MQGPALVRLVRPSQQYKNLVVFVALVFSRNLFETQLWAPAALTFLAFVLLSSTAYAWNDVLDAPRDREHPKKRLRPVASGAVQPTWALVFGGIFALAGLVLLSRINAETLMLGAAFLGLQVVYNLLLKSQVIWDVLAIGVGFVLRALAGTTALEVGPPTVWLVLITFLLAVFLGFAKRRHELVLFERGARGTDLPYRATLKEYTVEIVETMTNIVAALVLGSYFLYTAGLFAGTDAWMMLTIPFAVYGVLRYLYLVKRRDLGDEPELIFRDPPTVLNAAAWFLVVVLVLEGVPQGWFAWLQAL